MLVASYRNEIEQGVRSNCFTAGQDASIDIHIDLLAHKLNLRSRDLRTDGQIVI